MGFCHRTESDILLFSLHATIALDEYQALFHFLVLHRAARIGKLAKNQNENKCLQQESNQRSLALKAGALHLSTKTGQLMSFVLFKIVTQSGHS